MVDWVVSYLVVEEEDLGKAGGADTALDDDRGGE